MNVAQEEKVSIYSRDFCVAGTSFYPESKDVSENDQLFLELEPSNMFDSNAIKVLTKEGKLIGYVPRNYNLPIRTNLLDGATYEAVVTKMLYSGVPLVYLKMFSKNPDLGRES